MSDASPWTSGVLLGGWLGAQGVLIVLSVMVANAYRDRVLLWHVAAMVVALGTVVLQASGWPGPVPQGLMLLMALALIQLRALTAHVGSLRPRQRLLAGAALAIAVLAVADVLLPWSLLPAGVAIWAAVAALATRRAWPQSQPWILWLVPGQLALTAAVLHHGLTAEQGGADLVFAAILAFWSLAIYLASVWRSRVLGERRSGQDMAETLNPLTGLSTPQVLLQRVESARALMRRYGHPGSLVLLHLEYLDALAAMLGSEAAEVAALEAGTRIRDALGPGEVAARLGFQRFAVLSEGTPVAEAGANVAARILTAGLRAPLSGYPGNYFHFRAVITDLPKDSVVITELIEQLGERLTADVARMREKRIRIIPFGELELNTVPDGLPQAVTTRY